MKRSIQAMFGAISAMLIVSVGGTVCAAEVALAETTAINEVGVLKSNGIRHVSVDQAKTLIESAPEIIVLDVRTPREYRAGHIEGAININYFSLGFRGEINKLDKTKTYLIHCKSGHRSGRAAPIIKNAGIANVIHLDGGFDAWKAHGYPQISE